MVQVGAVSSWVQAYAWGICNAEMRCRESLLLWTLVPVQLTPHEWKGKIEQLCLQFVHEICLKIFTGSAMEPNMFTNISKAHSKYFDWSWAWSRISLGCRLFSRWQAVYTCMLNKRLMGCVEIGVPRTLHVSKKIKGLGAPLFWSQDRLIHVYIPRSLGFQPKGLAFARQASADWCQACAETYGKCGRSSYPRDLPVVTPTWFAALFPRRFPMLWFWGG